MTRKTRTITAVALTITIPLWIIPAVAVLFSYCLFLYIRDEVLP